MNNFPPFTTGGGGHDGADGLSAYQIWLQAGNIGTEQDFLNSLRGAGVNPAQLTAGTLLSTDGTNIGSTSATIDDNTLDTKGRTLRTGPQSVSLDPTQRISNGGDALQLTDDSLGLTREFVYFDTETANGTADVNDNRPYSDDYETRSVEDLQLVDTATNLVTGSVMIQATAATNVKVFDYRIKVRAEDANKKTRFLVRRTDATGPIYYRSHAEGDGFTLNPDANGLVILALPAPVKFMKGDVFCVELEVIGGTTVGFLGAAGSPFDYFVQRQGKVFTRRGMAYQGEDRLNLSTLTKGFLPKSEGGTLVDSVVTDEGYVNLQDSVRTLQNTAFNSGRSFLSFNDGFTIDRDNLPTFEDRNLIYTAKNDKAPDSTTVPNIHLPNSEEIQASSESYPIVFEFTHLGGTGIFQDRNLLIFFVDDVEIGRILRDQVAVLIKPSSTEPYQITSGIHDPNQTILPNGVFNLKTDTPIDKIDTIANELGGLTILAGDAYRVVVGGTWSGLTVPDNSVLVATVKDPSLVNNLNNNDWLLLDNPRVNSKSPAFLSNWRENGSAFRANRNIEIDPSNVLEVRSVANGLPTTRQILTNTQGSGRTARYDNVPITFSDIAGGLLSLDVHADTVSSSGFLIELTSVELLYEDKYSFVFPLVGLEIGGGTTTVNIQIPNDDYSEALGKNVSLRIHYNFRGVIYDGNITLESLVNVDTGTLHQPIQTLIDIGDQSVRRELNQQISNVLGNSKAENQSIAAIQDRISPYRRETLQTPNTSAYYSDNVDGSISPTPIQVSVTNPRFTTGTTSVHVYVLPDTDNVLLNKTSGAILLLDSTTTVASVTIGNLTLFVHRVGVAIGDTIEVMSLEEVRRVAWQEDLDILKAAVIRIDTELTHPTLNLPDNLIEVLENEVTVEEEDIPTTVASDYNKSFSGDQSQSIFYDVNDPSEDLLRTSPLSDEATTNLNRNKLVYFPTDSLVEGTLLSAWDGTTATPLLEYTDSKLVAKQFLKGRQSGLETSTQYVSESNGQGQFPSDPIDFVLGRVVDGDTLSVGRTVSVVRNLPADNEVITVSIDGVINGNDTGTRTFTLPFGGDSNITYITDTGFDTTVNIRTFYDSNNTLINIEATLDTINSAVKLAHFKVLLSYQNTRIVAGTSDTVRDVEAGTKTNSTDTVVMLTDLGNGDVLLVTDTAQVNTGYKFTDIFSGDESGTVQTTITDATFMNFKDLGASSVLIQQLENHTSLPQFGLFTNQYSHETIVNLDTQFTVLDGTGLKRNVGDLLRDLLSRVNDLES